LGGYLKGEDHSALPRSDDISKEKCMVLLTVVGMLIIQSNAFTHSSSQSFSTEVRNFCASDSNTFCLTFPVDTAEMHTFFQSAVATFSVLEQVPCC